MTESSFHKQCTASRDTLPANSDIDSTPCLTNEAGRSVANGTTSLDHFVGGKLKIRQPQSGYRAGSDPVLMAAAVPGLQNDMRVLELGCGVGTASLCLLNRYHNIHISGLEIQHDLADLAQLNAAENGFADRFAIHKGDIRTPPPQLIASSFDVVMANPPFYGAYSGRHSPNPQKARGTHHENEGLGPWVKTALKHLRYRGLACFIQRTESVGELVALLQPQASSIRLIPLQSKFATPAKRSIVIAQKGGQAGFRIEPALVLHRQDGRLTPEGIALLEKGKEMVFGKVKGDTKPLHNKSKKRPYHKRKQR